ncbi:hypothetical protein D3C72_86990 [compost metagenome]
MLLRAVWQLNSVVNTKHGGHMKKLLILASLASLSFSCPTWAADPHAYGTGGYWSQRCSPADAEHSRCIDYIAGTYDAYRTMQLNKMAPPIICAPDNIRYPQFAEVYGKFLRAHPELHPQPAGVLALRSLGLAFPCK